MGTSVDISIVGTVIATNTRQMTCEGMDVLVKRVACGAQVVSTHLYAHGIQVHEMARCGMPWRSKQNRPFGFGKVVVAPYGRRVGKAMGGLAKNLCHFAQWNNSTVSNSAVGKVVATIDKAKGHVMVGRFLAREWLVELRLSQRTSPPTAYKVMQGQVMWRAMAV